MSVQDLTISIVSSGLTIFDPLTLTADVALSIRVTNNGTTDLADLGVYVVTTTNLGEVDFPADSAPETDFQDLLTWGQAVENGDETVGGLRLLIPQTSGPDTDVYITRTQGSLKNNKLPMTDLDIGVSTDIQLTLETPPSVSARRVFISLVVE